MPGEVGIAILPPFEHPLADGDNAPPEKAVLNHIIVPL
jgi:hypothetical protein